MKTSNFFILFGIILSFILTSCEKEKRMGFSIEFSGDIVIGEDDISFYDSSTFILFLKDKISLPNITGEYPNIKYPEFSVFINDDNIYEGIIYPMASMVSPSPFFILEQIEPTEVVPLSFVGFTNVTDARNDQRIIDYLDSKNILHHGISCNLDSVYVYSYIDSSVTCKITIKNNDNVNYYIPDPGKMGAERFEYYIGGLTLINKETDEYLQASTENLSSEWNNLKMDHLSILESNGELIFTYIFTLNSPIINGNYKGDFRFGRMDPFGPVFRPDNLTLDQEEGRVWVGGTPSSLDNIIFN